MFFFAHFFLQVISTYPSSLYNMSGSTTFCGSQVYYWLRDSVVITWQTGGAKKSSHTLWQPSRIQVGQNTANHPWKLGTLSFFFFAPEEDNKYRSQHSWIMNIHEHAPHMLLTDNILHQLIGTSSSFRIYRFAGATWVWTSISLYHHPELLHSRYTRWAGLY